jgi:hypothetical protein
MNARVVLEKIKYTDGWPELCADLGYTDNHDKCCEMFEYMEYGDLEIIFDENFNIVGGKVIPTGIKKDVQAVVDEDENELAIGMLKVALDADYVSIKETNDNYYVYLDITVDYQHIKISIPLDDVKQMKFISKESSTTILYFQTIINEFKRFENGI